SKGGEGAVHQCKRRHIDGHVLEEFEKALMVTKRCGGRSSGSAGCGASEKRLWERSDTRETRTERRLRERSAQVGAAHEGDVFKRLLQCRPLSRGRKQSLEP